MKFTSKCAMVLSTIPFILSAQTPMSESNDYYMRLPEQTVSLPSSNVDPTEQCWYEKVPISGASQKSDTPNVGGAIVGGIVGGIVGHQFGSGSGNTAATITGAALGTAIGANSKNEPSEPQYQLIRKCNTLH
jgi:uncharacterized protein YcfJ